jgi:hypothetical protein
MLAEILPGESAWEHWGALRSVILHNMAGAQQILALSGSFNAHKWGESNELLSVTVAAVLSKSIADYTTASISGIY